MIGWTVLREREWMQNTLFVAFMVMALVACSPESASDRTLHHPEAMRDSVRAFLEVIPVALAAEGPEAWLRFFEDAPSFFMASDGHAGFPGRDSADVFLKGFSRKESFATSHDEPVRRRVPFLYQPSLNLLSMLLRGNQRVAFVVLSLQNR